MSPTPVPSRKLLRRLVLALMLGLVAFVGGSWVSAYKLTGPYHRSVGLPPRDFPFVVQEVSWTTSDAVAIKGWFIAGDNLDRAIVLLHGYSDDRRKMLPRAEHLRRLGYSVLLYDARACGESGGDLVTFGYHEADDLLGALAWLRQKGFRRIACLGVSQGGATILMAAEELQDVSCVVVESVFDELEHAVDNRFRHYCLVPGRVAGCLMIPLAEQRTGLAVSAVRPIDQVGKLPCPVFIISGATDTKTLPAETERLFTAAREPKDLWLVPGAGHEDMFRPEYAQRVSKFLDQYLK